MLKLDCVNISYGAIKAVRDVSLEIPKGQVVTIIGANGAGKSTLLKSVVGLEPVVTGRVLLDGKGHNFGSGAQENQARRRAFAGGARRFPDQTVQDNLLLGAYAVKDGASTAEKVERSYKMFPRLRERQDQMAGTLSGGEQQMLAIARALMCDPKLLLLDEPSLGLAPIIIQDIFKTIRTLRETGLTILLVEQMANQALAVADFAYVLETGRITHQGKGSDLLNDEKVRAAYLGAH